MVMGDVAPNPADEICLLPVVAAGGIIPFRPHVVAMGAYSPLAWLQTFFRPDLDGSSHL